MVCHHLIDHAVAGEQILHLAGRFVGASGNDEDVFPGPAIVYKGLDRVAAQKAAHENTVAGIGREARLSDLNCAEAGIRLILRRRAEIGAHEVQQHVIAEALRIGKHLLASPPHRLRPAQKTRR